MEIVRKIIDKIRHPRLLGIYFIDHTARIWSDKIFLKMMYRLRMGKPLNLDKPETYNEKLQWLKLYDRRPEYTMMVDKIAVKDHVKNLIGEEFIIPTLGVWDNPDDIDFDALPNQFVLKCNHDSGGIVICSDKSKLDIAKAKRGLRKALKRRYFYHGREWAYKNVKPQILAEKYMVDESGYELKDYKIFCFNGEPKVMFIASDRSSKTEDTKFDFFDMDFKHLPFLNGHPNSKMPIHKPESFEKMKQLAAKLSAGIPHVRVDFYDINGQIYFGELTFCHWSGMVPFEPEEWDYKLGEMITIP